MQQMNLEGEMDRSRRADRPGVRCGWRQSRSLLAMVLAAGMLAGLWSGQGAGARRGRAPVPVDPAAALETRPATAPSQFAPLPEDHPLANLWNEPEFTRRLVGSYGFLSDREPRMTAEEQALYRDTILPLLREDPLLAVPALEAAIQPGASAIFDYTLATVHFQHEDLGRAVARYEAALAKFPDFLRAQRNLALALVREGRMGEAIPALTRTLTLGGADGRIYGFLALAYVAEGRPVAAEPAFRQALLFDPDNLELQLGLLRCLVSLRHYDPALALLDELIPRHPDRESLWALQANIHVQQEDLGRAIVVYEMLRRLGRATAAHLSVLGDLHLSREAPDLALSAYLEALEGGPDRTRAIRAAGLLTSRGAWEEARELFARIRGLPGEPLSGADELTLLRLEARVSMAGGDGTEAIGVIEELLRRNPLDGEALLLAGDYYAREGEPERAELRYDAAAKLEGFEAEALVKHAQLLVRGQRYTQALELLRKAQRIAPRDNVQRYLERVEQVAVRARG